MHADIDRGARDTLADRIPGQYKTSIRTVARLYGLSEARLHRLGLPHIVHFRKSKPKFGYKTTFDGGKFKKHNGKRHKKGR